MECLVQCFVTEVIVIMIIVNVTYTLAFDMAHSSSYVKK